MLTQHNDIGRTGQNTTETILTPANVSSGNFGKIGTLPLDGDAYAQPLYMSALNIGGVNHSVVFIATEHDSVYAFDAGAGGRLLWKATMLDAAHGAAVGSIPDPESDTGCNNVNGPEYGIMGTPVIDGTTNTMYVVSLTYENGYPVQRLHALDITNGNEKFGGPTTIKATVAGTGAGSYNGQLSFDPKYNNQRAGLLLVNGVVYIAWASHCDSGPWHGWLMGYNASTLAQSTVFVTTPNGGGSGIWMSGAGLAADIENGVPRMFVPTGNGTYDATAPYGTNTMDYGDDILRLNLTNGIQVADAFTPSNQDYLAQYDMDVASGGLIVLPDNLPGSTVPHEAVQMAKSGIITVLNRENLGGYNSTDQSLQQVAATIFTTDGIGGYGLWGAPAYWNNNLYVWPAQSLPNGNLLQYSITNGLLSTSPVAMSTQSDTWQGNQFWGATPSVSANGNTNGIVWVDDTGNYNGGVPQYFYALDATNVSKTLWSSNTNPNRDNAAIEQKYTVPTIADGRVFLMASRQMLVYGMLDFSMSVPTSVAVNPGNDTTATIALSSSTSFMQGVTFSASGVPAGVSVSFAPGANGGEAILFSATSNAAPGTSTVTITAARGTTTQSSTLTLTVGGLPDFLLSAAPATALLGTTGYSAVTATPQNGFTGTPTFSAVSVPPGVTAAVTGCSASGCTLLLSVSPTMTIGQYPITIQATSGALVHSFSTTVTISRTSYTNVDMSKYFNVNAAVTDGTSPPNGGMDGFGYALSSTLLGNSVSWAGTTFQVGPANAPNGASYETVPLPSGNFVNLQMLASRGGASPIPVTINYTDGSSASFTQGFSNWGSPSGYPGESIADTMSYRISPTGTQSPGNPGWYVYGYTFPVNNQKTVKSVTLPSTGAVVVMAMALSSSTSVPQTISFSPIASQQTGPTVPLNATASSGLPVTFSSATPNVCTMSGSTASVVSSGTCTIVASQSGNATYAAASTVSQSFSVASQLQSQSITFSAIATQSAGGQLVLSASTTSGLAVAFASSTTGVCTVSGNTASLLAAGTCTLIASQAGNSVYAAATPVSQTFTVTPLYQMPVSLSAYYNVNSLVNNGTAPANGGFDGASYAYAANLLGSTATWNGAQFTLGPPNVADSVSAVAVSMPTGSFSSLRLLAAASFGTQSNQPFVLTYSDGTKTTITQSLSDWGAPVNYSGEAIAVTSPYRITPNGTSQSYTWDIYGYTFPVNSAKTLASVTLPNNRQIVVLAMTLTSTSPIAQTIAFGSLANQQIGATVAMSATASSGLPVVFASSTPSVCTVSGNSATTLGGGTCTLVASQAGNANYAAAPNVSQSFTVSYKAQTIAFATLPSQTIGSTIVLAATSSSGLAVAFSSSNNSVCTVSGTSASMVGAGTCAITASQSGNSIYAAATPVSNAFTVSLNPQTISFSAVSTKRAGTSVALSATATSGLAVAYTSSTTTVCTVSGSTTSLLASGTCTIAASQSGSSSYAAASPVSQSFTVAPPQVVVPLSTVYNVYGLFNSGASPTNGGLDNAGYSYASNLLGTAASWNGAPFTLGNAGVADAVTSVKVPLPSGSFASLQMLATGVFGGQGNQPFVVTYTDGTSATFTQSLSDWGAPSQYSGETIALSTTYRITPNGTTQVQPGTNSWATYGYSFALNSAKTVSSITLPNNRNVIVLAMTLSPTAIAQTIAFGAVPSQVTATTLSLAATASSGLPVTYTSSTPSVCTVSGGTATLSSAGTCTITAAQFGNSNYAAAAAVSQSFTVTTH